MTISTGSKLGPYEVSSVLGAGGMGVVYRARDERIGRDVAIKVLPDSFSANEERRRRFEQEARAAGGLNHPNLVTIYDIGDHDGAPFLVMELLEGESLREKLEDDANVRIPSRKAADYAAQIAHGLAAAHDKGIVHRDLKPENIFVTNDGRVKILDFGLAKLETAEAADGLTDQKTAQRDTAPGAVMGTVGYMSPEQVRGRQVDHRTDIFAFGAILYEMLSGSRTFGGESSADTMSAILNEDPPELSGEGLPIPQALDRIVHRCLEKNREERFHSAHDLALSLEVLSGGSTTSGSRVVIEDGARSSMRRNTIMTLGVAVLVVGAFYAGRVLRSESVTATSDALVEPRLTQLTFQRGVEANPSVSPDGGSIVYSSIVGRGNSDIFVLRVGGENPVNLTSDSTEADVQPMFSPDGSRIAYANIGTDAPGIYVMGATGEARRRLTEFGGDPSWYPDGSAIVFSSEPVFDPKNRFGIAKLWRVDATTSEVIEIDIGGGDGVQPRISPDGRRIAFWGLPQGTGKRVIYTIPVEGGTPVAITTDESFNWNPAWAPNGDRLFFVSDRGGTMNLWQVAIDKDTGQKSGPFEAVTIGGQLNGEMSISADGAIVFTTGPVAESLKRHPVDSKLNLVGPPEEIYSGSRDLWSLDPSWDGDWVVIGAFDDREDLFVASADGSQFRRLTNDGFKDRMPRWGHDSESIFFYSDRSGRYGVWSVRRDGSGLKQLTRSDGDGLGIPVPSPDGTSIAYWVTDDPARFAALSELSKPLGEDNEVWFPALDDRIGFQPEAWSNDGKRIAGVGMFDNSIPVGVWFCDVEEMKCRKLTDDGMVVGWLPDGERLAVRGERSDRLEIVNVESMDVTEGMALPEGVTRPRLGNRDVVLSADGRWVWIIEADDQRDIWMLDYRTADVVETR
jgi:serine/threonine protein kinase